MTDQAQQIVGGISAANTAAKVATGAKARIPYFSSAKAAVDGIIYGKLPDASTGFGITSDGLRVAGKIAGSAIGDSAAWPLAVASGAVMVNDWAKDHKLDTPDETASKGLSDANGALDSLANLVNGVRTAIESVLPSSANGSPMASTPSSPAPPVLKESPPPATTNTTVEETKTQAAGTVASSTSSTTQATAPVETIKPTPPVVLKPSESQPRTQTAKSAETNETSPSEGALPKEGSGRPNYRKHMTPTLQAQAEAREERKKIMHDHSDWSPEQVEAEQLKAAGNRQAAQRHMTLTH